MKFIQMVAMCSLAAAPCRAATLMDSIQKADDAFSAAANRGDAPGIARLYTPSAIALPPGAPEQRGRDAIGAYWAAALKAGVKNVSLKAGSVESYGTAAREIGRFGFDMPGAGGQSSRVEGKYVVVWKRVGGAWMLDSDIWNTDK